MPNPNPFAASIRWLLQGISAQTKDEKKKVAAAIRLLEAAGKVDNVQRAIALMKHSSELRYIKVIHLLEALPSGSKDVTPEGKE